MAYRILARSLRRWINISGYDANGRRVLLVAPLGALAAAVERLALGVLFEALFGLNHSLNTIV